MAPLLNVIENKSTNDVFVGVDRLDCKVGMAIGILTDQDSGTMKASDEMKVNMKEIDLILFEENKIRLENCPMSKISTNKLAEQKVRPVSESLEPDGIPKEEDKCHNLVKSFAKKQIVDKAVKSLIKPLYTENSTLKKVEKVVKLTKDVKTDVEFNTEFESKIILWLDRKSTCKRSCFQSLSPDLRQIEYLDVLNRGCNAIEKQSREMSKYDYVFPGWSKFLTFFRAGASS